MADVKRSEKSKKRGVSLLGSRIARLIFASNMAGLAILIVGAMILNEMRGGLVVARTNSQSILAQAVSSMLADSATVGVPEPALSEEAAKATIKSMDLDRNQRAKIYLIDGEVIADSFFLSERVDIDDLPPLKTPSGFARMTTALSNWSASVFRSVLPSGAGDDAVRTKTIEEEHAIAFDGGQAASQRFSDRGQRIISVSVPIQHVSAVVGVLTLESSDIQEIVRAERAALIPFIGVAVLVAFITSILLTLGIARPLRRLSIAADRIGSGAAEKFDVPSLTKRKDEIGTLSQSVEEMTEALVERVQANESFAADVAHELKNPLTSIRSAVETAEMVQDDPVAREKLRKVIAKDVQRLDRLITDISNASRLEAEITRTPRANMRIAKMLRDIVQTYDHLSDDGRAQVIFRDETMGAGLMVRGREGPLGQVFRNLIDNAISFSPAGGEVSITLRQGADGSQTLAVITIEDSGPGIPEDKLEKIFERFYTDRPAGAAFGNNSGLGLSIVKQIIETHQGSVTASNRKEGGAQFRVKLQAS